MRHLPVWSPAPRELRGREVALTIDGRAVSVREGATILDACAALGIAVPTLCQFDTLAPVNVCRVCVVELTGSRALVPACSRKVEPNMVVATDSERVRTSRKVVFELLASSVDTSLSDTVRDGLARYGGRPERFGAPAEPSGQGVRDAARAGQHHATDGARAAVVAQPVKDDNDLFVRDYARCVLCYKCVEACGDDAQNTFAITVAGRGFDARIATEFDVRLDASACVFCGNCVGVCPTGALMFKTEHAMRCAETWAPERQTQATTVCPYCGVGCAVTLHVQDERVVKVSSPAESSVTSGNLCIKGRFGWQYVNSGR